MRIRREGWIRSEFAQQERIKMGSLCIDLAAHEVTIDGVPRPQVVSVLLPLACR